MNNLEEKLKAKEEEIDFDAYFAKNKFGDFEKFFGASVEDFKIAYGNFKKAVENYFDTYIPDGMYGALFPLVADICPYVRLGFFATLDADNSRVHYPAISILDGVFYATPKREKVKFLECEEVMRRLLCLYKDNEEFFEEGKRLAAEPKEPIICGDIRNLGF